MKMVTTRNEWKNQGFKRVFVIPPKTYNKLQKVLRISDFFSTPYIDTLPKAERCSEKYTRKRKRKYLP